MDVVLTAPGVADGVGTTGRAASDGADCELLCSVAGCSSLTAVDPVALWGGLETWLDGACAGVGGCASVFRGGCFGSLDGVCDVCGDLSSDTDFVPL